MILTPALAILPPFEARLPRQSMPSFIKFTYSVMVKTLSGNLSIQA
jgi:hypothetical protein